MKKKIICLPLLSIFLSTVSAYSAVQQEPVSAKTHSERITVHGLSRNIIAEAKQKAEGFCKEQNKPFTFIRNVIRTKSLLGVEWITCDLYFSCTPPVPKPSAPPPPPEKSAEIIPEKKEQPAEPKIDAVKKELPQAVAPTTCNVNKPKKAEAVLPKVKTKLAPAPYRQGEPESLGPEPPGQGDAQPSGSNAQGTIIEETIIPACKKK